MTGCHGCCMSRCLSSYHWWQSIDDKNLHISNNLREISVNLKSIIKRNSSDHQSELESRKFYKTNEEIAATKFDPRHQPVFVIYTKVYK